MTDLLDVLTELRRETEHTSRLAWTALSDRPSGAPSDGPSGAPSETPSETRYETRYEAPAPRIDRPAGIFSGSGPALRDTLLRRRSRRFFTDAAVTLEELTAMVADGLQMDGMLWPQLHRRQPLEVFLAARAVTGLAPALYSLAGPDPVRLADLPPDEGLAGMVLQPEFAQAAALLVVTGSLADAVGVHGGHGHRVLLERSGAVAETAWLTGVQRGLGGSIFAGFLPTALRNLAGVDGFHRTQLLALAIGHPTDSAEPAAVSASG